MTNTGGTVTLLFTDLVGSTELLSEIGDDAAQELRRSHFRLLRDAVAAGAGHEVKSLGDGLMVVFTSAVDAVGCAVAMQHAIHQQHPSSGQLQVRVGVHVGEPIREEDDYFGMPVVVARRLCDQAQGGQILVSELVRSLVGTRGGFAFRDVGPRRLKGLAQPVPAWEVLWQAVAEPLPLPPVLAVGERSTFVGRTQDLGRLRHYWARARGGERQLAFIAGEAGIGKTRLTTELARAAHAQGATVLYGRCYEEALMSYQPFSEALRHYVTACRVHELRAQPAARVGELVRLVPELGQRLPNLPAPLRGDPEGERYRLFEAVSSFLIDASHDHPVVLILDDLHWADRETLFLLKHVARATVQSPLLIVGTYRETEVARAHPLAEALADLRREYPFERITLAGLDESDTGALIRAIAGHDTPPAFTRAVYGQTEGNPFFIEEVLRHLIETGVVYQQEGRWRTDRHVDELGIPEGVREVIGRRLSRLSQRCYELLTIAAVVGREFDVQVLERVAVAMEPVPTPDQLLAVLEEAVAARIVDEVPHGFGRYVFSHTLIREKLYTELTTNRRIQLHRRIGAALESLYEANVEPHLGELAYHFFAAAQGNGDIDKAVDYGVRAAERATALLAYEDALSYYQRALHALALKAPQDEMRHCEVVLALAEAWGRAGDREKAKETFLQAAQLAKPLQRSELLARAALGFGPWLWAGFVDVVQIGLLEEAVAALGTAESALRARVLGRLAVALYWSDAPQRRDTLSEEAVAIARGIGDPATLAYVLLCRHLATWGPDNVDERLAIAGEAVRLAEQSGDAEMAMQGHEWRLVDLLELGQIEEVDAEIEALAALAEQLRQPRHTWFVANCRAMRALLAGRFDEAEQLAQQAMGIGQPLQDETVGQAFGVQLFMVQRERGQLEGLEAGFQGLVAQYPAVPAWRCGLAYLYSQLGRHAEAQRELDDLAAHDFADLPKDYLWLMATASLLAPVCNVLGDTRRAAQLYERLRPYAGRCVALYSTIVSGCASRYLVLLATTLGRWEDGARHFAEAMEIDSRMGARSWVAHDQHEYAALLLARGRPEDREPALALLDRAIETAQELGMAVLHEEAAALKRSAQRALPIAPHDQRDLRLLAYELGRAFADRLRLDELIPYVADRCRELLNAESAAVLLIDPARNEFYFPSVAEDDPQIAARLLDVRFPADRGIAGATLQAGKPLRVDDAPADPRFYDGVDRITGRATRNIVAAPLKAGQRTKGVLEVVNRRGGAPFTDDDLVLLDVLAGSVAIAIERARP
jgi:class 3 adenylate cyclase